MNGSRSCGCGPWNERSPSNLTGVVVPSVGVGDGNIISMFPSFKVLSGTRCVDVLLLLICLCSPTWSRLRTPPTYRGHIAKSRCDGCGCLLLVWQQKIGICFRCTEYVYGVQHGPY